MSIKNLLIEGSNPYDINVKTVTTTQQSFVDVKPSATVLNVTGDGTEYQVLYDTEITDKNSDFASSAFTAPVTGAFVVNANFSLGGITTNHVSAEMWIDINANTDTRLLYYGNLANMADGSAIALVSTNAALSLTAGDVIIIKIKVSATDKTIDITGGTSLNIYRL